MHGDFVSFPNLPYSSHQLLLSYWIATKSPALYQAVIAKHGISTMQGTIQLGPMIQWWKNLDQGKAFLKRFVGRPNSVDMVNGVPVCHNNTDDTGAFVFKEVMPNGKYTCTGYVSQILIRPYYTPI